MISKRFQKVNKHPDVAVYPHAGSKEQMNVTNFGYGGWWGAGHYRYGGAGAVDVNYYTAGGTLFLDIVDMHQSTSMEKYWQSSCHWCFFT